MIERGMEGFVNGRKLDKVGQDESDTAELFFENVRVPDANRLGPEGLGFVAMMQRLPQERVGASVANTAHAKQIFWETIAVRQGAQGLRPVHRAVPAQQVQDGRDGHQARGLSGLCRRLRRRARRAQAAPVDAAKAKWWSAQVQSEVLDECVQLHGGYGFMNEYRVARAWRDARVTKIWAGSNEIMKELIGRDLGF
jgi:alkylation response protein AidB-like acyl-CoA dehydrogenase